MFESPNTDLEGLKAELESKEEQIMLKATDKIDKLRNHFTNVCEKVVAKCQGRLKGLRMIISAAEAQKVEMEELEEKAKEQLSRAYF